MFTRVSLLAILAAITPNLQASEAGTKKEEITLEAVLTQELAYVDKRGKDRFAKVFEIKQGLSAGDCRSDTNPPHPTNPTLTLFEDGHISWQAVVWSRDTNDAWRIDFIFMASVNGPVLGSTPPWVFPMRQSLPRKYLWGGTTGPNALLAPQFPGIQVLRYRYSC